MPVLRSGMPTSRAPFGSSAMARNARPGFCLVEEKKEGRHGHDADAEGPHLPRHDGDNAGLKQRSGAGQGFGVRNGQALVEGMREDVREDHADSHGQHHGGVDVHLVALLHDLLEQGRREEIQRHRGGDARQNPQNQIVSRCLQHHPRDVHREDHDLRIGEVNDHGHEEKEIESRDQEHVDASRGKTVDKLGYEDLHSMPPGTLL